jgi:NAD(P)-dependent dehydrogenase (short-subunit alcohol dehydrogenase family)
VNVIYCQGNISSTEDRKKILQRVKDHYNKLNILVNNAGIAPRERRDLLGTPEESFDEVISINLKGNYFLTQNLLTG